MPMMASASAPAGSVSQLTGEAAKLGVGHRRDARLDRRGVHSHCAELRPHLLSRERGVHRGEIRGSMLRLHGLERADHAGLGDERRAQVQHGHTEYRSDDPPEE